MEKGGDLINDEATLKRYYIDEEKKMVRLRKSRFFHAPPFGGGPSGTAAVFAL